MGSSGHWGSQHRRSRRGHRTRACPPSATLAAAYTGCCRAYFVVMKAKAFDGSGEEWYLANSKTVDPDTVGGTYARTWFPRRQFVRPHFDLVEIEVVAISRVSVG